MADNVSHYNSKYTGAQIDAGVAGGLNAVPISRTVNGKALSSDISISASDVGAVPNTRTVNGKALSSNISLSAADVGAVPASEKAAAEGVATLDSNGLLTYGQQNSNPNLMDNWYFADPINQRGHTEYESYGYGIDRFRVQYGTKIELLSDCVKLIGSWDISQSLETFLPGTYTLSLMYRNLQPETGRFLRLVVCGIASDVMSEFPEGTVNVFSFTWTISQDNINDANNNGIPIVSIAFTGGKGYDEEGCNSVELIACKLETGSRQTLAHQENGVWFLNDPPPNKAIELAKCQRYYQILPQVYQAISSESGVIPGRHFLVRMRTIPSVRIFGNFASGISIESNGVYEGYAGTWGVDALTQVDRAPCSDSSILYITTFSTIQPVNGVIAYGAVLSADL